jgi:tetratricopeptide (TPR) repeat protein
VNKFFNIKTDLHSSGSRHDEKRQKGRKRRPFVRRILAAAMILCLMAPSVTAFGAEDASVQESGDVSGTVYTDRAAYEEALAAYQVAYQNFLSELEAYRAAVEQNAQIEAENEAAQQAYEEALAEYETAMDEYLQKLEEYTEALADVQAAEERNQEIMTQNAELLQQYEEQLAAYEEAVANYTETVRNIESENEAAWQEYLQQLAIYEQQLQEYEEAIAAYEQLIEERNAILARNQALQEEYEAELAEYNAAMAEYEKEYAAYLEEKAAYEEAVAENASKKAQYEADLEAYYEKVALIAENEAAGHYSVPSTWYNLTNMYQIFIRYDATQTFFNYGLSISGDDMVSQINSDKAQNPMPNETMNDLLDQLAAADSSMYSWLQSINAYLGGYYVIRSSTVESMVQSNTGYTYYMDIGAFTYSFTSSTGETQSNLPDEFENLTEENLIQAAEDLLTEWGGTYFDGTSEKTGAPGVVTADMLSKWEETLALTKTKSESLFIECLQDYLSTYQTYLNSDKGTDALNSFNAGVEAAMAKEEQAYFLAAGTSENLLNEDGNFTEDLQNLSEEELADKYGYLGLLQQMANLTAWGYFNLLTPQSGEVIGFETAQSYTNSRVGTVTGVQSVRPADPVMPTEPVYEDVTEPVAPTAPDPVTPPEYETVPDLPEEPTAPTAPTAPTELELPEAPVAPEEPVLQELAEVPELPEEPTAPTEPDPPILKALLVLGEAPVAPTPPIYIETDSETGTETESVTAEVSDEKASGGMSEDTTSDDSAGETTSDESLTESGSVTSPQTGDETHAAVWLALMAISGILALSLLRGILKKKNS